MDPDLQNLEASLKALRPRGLNERLLNRLDDALEGRLQAGDASQKTVEAELTKVRPAALSESFADRLAGVVARVPFPVDDKVVLFPGGSVSDRKRSRPGNRWLAAAAAVAMAGGLSALLMSPGNKPPQGLASERRPVAAPRPVNSDPGAFAPATFNSGVSGASDQGVVWSKDKRPMRKVRVEFRDKVRFLNERGEQVEVEVPRVEFMLVPEKID